MARYTWGGNYVWPIDFTLAKRFDQPPWRDEDTPQSLFTPGNASRFISRSDNRRMLIFTGGSCHREGQDTAVGGCAFVLKRGEGGVKSFCLEDHGPTGKLYIHTSQRAELRAVIAALQFRDWGAESYYNELVIATDSKLVVEGATAWVETWARSNWIESGGEEVKNQDLWMLLFQEIEILKLKNRSLRVLFWHITRELNEVADRAAKEVAEAGALEGREFFTPIYEDGNRERQAFFAPIHPEYWTAVANTFPGSPLPR